MIYYKNISNPTHPLNTVTDIFEEGFVEITTEDALSIKESQTYKPPIVSTIEDRLLILETQNIQLVSDIKKLQDRITLLEKPV